MTKAEECDGRRYLYRPAQDPDQARDSALSHLVRTFFGDSPARAANALLGMRGERLNDKSRGYQGSREVRSEGQAKLEFWQQELQETRLDLVRARDRLERFRAD